MIIEEAAERLRKLRAQAEEAEARYDHETAVARYTAALELPDLSPRERYDLLDGRANAYFRWGHLRPYARAINDLVALAREIGDPTLLAEAVLVHGFHVSYDGQERPSREVVDEAIGFAEEMQDARLLCFAHLLLTTIYYEEEQQFDQSWAMLHKGLEFARRSEDAGALFAAVEFQSGAHSVFRQHKEAQAFAAEARALAAATGDLCKISRAAAKSGIAANDLAVQRRYYESAYATARSANDEYGMADVANLLGLLFWKLGLYDSSLACATEATERARRLQLAYYVANDLDCLGRAYLGKEMVGEARQAFREGLDYEEAGWANIVFHNLGLAMADLAEGAQAEAAERLQMLLHRYGFDPLEPTIHAFLSTAYLALQDSAKALEHSSRAVALLETRPTAGEFHTQEIWWRHYQVVQMVDPQLSYAMLDKAKESMLEAIATLSDEGLRRNYLNKVAVNRAITLAWVEEAARRGQSIDEFTAHEPIAGNLREQFRRVTAIGTRLTAQHDPDSLADFIVREFVEMSGAERVLLLSLEEGRSSVRAAFNSSGAEDLAVALLQEVAQSRRPLLRQDVGQIPAGAVPEIHQRSLVALPLIAQNKLLGLLYGDMRQVFGRFDENDRNLLSMLANQAAAALDNADLVRSLEEKVEERTAALVRAKREAEAANESKSRFLASMSHELRTPLNAIIGFTRIVQRKTRGMIPERQSDNLDKVKSSAEHLLGLINSVLDLAKIEAGRVDVVQKSIDVEALVRSCAAVTEPLLRPGVAISIEVESGMPELISDEEKVRQILLNLLSNAAKFTHEGEIVMSGEWRVASRESEFVTRNADSQLIIEVRDTGIGMNEEQLSRVFEEFQQAEETTGKTYGGTGLGLPISKQLAQLLGGDLRAESTPGQGSTFILTLPLQDE